MQFSVPHKHLVTQDETLIKMGNVIRRNICQPSESLLGSMSTFQSSAKNEKAIIMLLYSTCGGKDWLQQDAWLTSSNVCNWIGIECNEEENVKALILDNNKVAVTHTRPRIK